jgi:hypothetical protein
MAISSPFDSGWKDTTPQSPSGGMGAGAVPGPAADYPQNQVLTELGTTSASWDSPYNEGIVQSTSTVTSADPGGSAPMESPFTDAIAK